MKPKYNIGFKKKKAVKPHHRHECDLGQSDIRGPASDWLSGGTASAHNTPLHPHPVLSAPLWVRVQTIADFLPVQKR